MMGNDVRNDWKYKNVGIWCEEGWEMTSGTMWNIKEFSHCREPSRYREKWSPKTL